jgi:hypothetical protein
MTNEAVVVEQGQNAQAVKLIVERWLLLRDDRAELDERLAELGDQLVALLGVGGSCEIAPGVGVRVQQGSRLIDRSAVARYLTGEEFASVCRLVVDPTLLRQRFPMLADDLLLPPAAPSLRKITP